MRNYLNLPGSKPKTKAGMIEFLVNHPNHSDGFSRPKYFSRNIKISNIHELTRSEKESCYASIETPWDLIGIELVLKQFSADHPGYAIYSAGRSSGHLELHSILGDYSEYHPEYRYQRMDKPDVLWQFNLVWDFDKACQNAVDVFVNYALHMHEEVE